jgi:O-acetylhomoserine/O-acetylserine sulfhydrylase-like pyridoxal-dependent enzyme
MHWRVSRGRKRTGLFIWVSGNRLFDAGLKPGDEVIAMDDLYGGTYRLFTKIYKDSGILFHFVDMNDMEKFKSLINENTKLVWVETPTNPMMKLVDIEAIAKITKANKVLLLLIILLQHRTCRIHWI